MRYSCTITPPWQEMSSATMQGQEFPTSGKYLGIVISAHLAGEFRCDYRLTIVSSAHMLITGALAVIDITYVKIIDGVTLKYAQ
jgi:hypothetical protein